MILLVTTFSIAADVGQPLNAQANTTSYAIRLSSKSIPVIDLSKSEKPLLRFEKVYQERISQCRQNMPHSKDHEVQNMFWLENWFRLQAKKWRLRPLKFFRSCIVKIPDSAH